MPDVFADITAAPPDMIDVIANVLETRAAIPSQQEMLQSYLGEITFREKAKVLEVGCGTGPICRVLAKWPNVGEVIGVDPSESLLEKARELASDIAVLSFQKADGQELPFKDCAFDVVILHTILTHVPEQEKILAEAFRVLRPNGWLGVCDGDFSTASLQICDPDPLEACTEALVQNFVNDRWFVRKMSSLVQKAGFKVNPLRSYGLVETISPDLTMTWIDRGADALAQKGSISIELAEALKAEGRRRAESGEFFGYMAYASLTATKP